MKKIFSLVTSHFDNVKAFALSHKYISNASMEFDELNYSPTYKFRLGVPGKSYGLLMAKRYKLNSEILETSKKYVEKIGSHELEDSISHLNNEIRRYEKLSKSLIDKENNIKIRESALKIKEEKIIKLEEDYTEKVDERIDMEIQKTLDEIDNILKEIKKGGVKEHQIINAKTKLKNINANSNTSIEDNINIEVKLGDLVNIKSAGISGKVVQIRKNKVSILSNGFTYDAKIDDLSVIGEISSVPKPLKTNKIDLISESIPLEINVIGQRGDEALINVSKYLDSARLKNLKTVRIIHGSGKGILRKLIHEYLAKCDFVKNYHLGGYYDGQGGATIVEFK